MRLTRFLFTSFLISIVLGQLGRFSPAIGVNIYLKDLLLVITVASWVLWRVRKARFLLHLPLAWPMAGFTLACLFSLALASRVFYLKEVLVGSLYLARWIFYAGVYFVAHDLARNSGLGLISKILIVLGALVALLGFIQLGVYPDFAPMTAYGWDPHYYRLLSTFFDPNFVGGFLVLALVFLVSLYLFSKNLKPKEKILVLGSMGFVYLALVLTYSRSAYVAFLISMATIGFLKSKRVFGIALIVFLLSLQLNPRARQRVEGAVQADKSASHRLVSWEKAIVIIKKHPVFGVGFNTYRYAQLRYHLLDPDELLPGGHAGAGVDSSLLFVWATTGLVGLLLYLWLIGKAIFISYLQAKNNPYVLAAFSSLAALLFHSLFVNSLFYPPIMAWMWTMLGLAEAKKT